MAHGLREAAGPAAGEKAMRCRMPCACGRVAFAAADLGEWRVESPALRYGFEAARRQAETVQWKKIEISFRFDARPARARAAGCRCCVGCPVCRRARSTEVQQ